MQSHCGVCSQCIDRRFATLATGLEEYDPPERYRVDIFRQGLSLGKDQTLALSFARFAAEVEDLDEIGLFFRFAELSECLDPNDPNCSIVAERLVALLKRHAGSVLRVVEDQIAAAKVELARESLPPNCLIRLIVGSSVAVMRTDSFRHSPDYREVWLDDEKFSLTTNQARVVELLDHQRLGGAEALSQGYILETLDIGS
jgi:hypothetical protein